FSASVSASAHGEERPMTHQISRCVMLVATFALVHDALAEGQVAAPDALVVLQVRIENQAHVPPSLLRVAERRAADVFGRIDVRTEWIEGPQAARENRFVPYTILLMGKQVAERKAAAEGLDEGVV